MARHTLKIGRDEAEDEKATKVLEMDDFLSSREIPSYIKLSRDAVVRVPDIQKDLFSELEEKESNEILLSAMTEVNELDLQAFIYALQNKLYVQSYQSGNLEMNTGVADTEDFIGQQKRPGEIVVSLSDLCRTGYGEEPTNRTKKKMASIINLCDSRKVHIIFPNGDKYEFPICSIMGKYTRAKDGAVIYDLYLHPIFTHRIKSFGILPVNAMAGLTENVKRKTAAHIYLLSWLSIQDNKEPHSLLIGTLVKKIGKENEYKANRGRTEKSIIALCEDMKKIGIIKSFSVTYKEKRRGNVISAITFYLNPKYTQIPTKETPQAPEE